MSRITVKSFVKINLSIDVGKVGDTGYHPVDMVMQQLSFHDDVTVDYTPSDDSGSFDIEVRTNRYYLPVDRRNLAYQAAELMIELVQGSGKTLPPGSKDIQTSGEDLPETAVSEAPVSCGLRSGELPRVAPGKIVIDIKKRIPVAGGLAGGSGNGAAVLHALNILWDLRLSLRELMDLGAKLGSDVPFCVMGQARANRDFPDHLREDPMASSCARATGRGTDLEPSVPLRAWMVIAKPKFSVSTKEVYEGIDAIEIGKRPDNDRLLETMRKSAERNKEDFAVPGVELYRDCINVLEEYTLTAYPEVEELKEDMMKSGADFALMSGSGPTVFGIFGSMREAEEAAQAIQKKGMEAYWTRTTL